MKQGFFEAIFEGANWSRRSGLNGRPADYESAALPLSYAGMLRNVKKACWLYNI